MEDPKNWTIDRLQEWLKSPLTQERKDFDLKEMIPPDVKGKYRLKKDFCGLANSTGGYIFFGIKDDKTIPGIDEDLQFTTKINEIVTKHIYPPTITWNLHHCIQTDTSNKYVYIVKISESPYWQKPHSFYEQHEGLRIPLRENGSKRSITDGAEIRRLFFKLDRYYPEYNVHIFNILNELKTKAVPVFSFVEISILQGFKSFLRSSTDTQTSTIITSLEEIERAVSACNTPPLSTTDGGVVSNDSVRKRMVDLVDSFISQLKVNP